MGPKITDRLNKSWSRAELDYLRNNYGRVKTSRLAKELGRTSSAIHSRLNILGLTLDNIKDQPRQSTVFRLAEPPKPIVKPITNVGGYALAKIERRFETLDDLNVHVKANGTECLPVRLLHMVKIATDSPLT